MKNLISAKELADYLQINEMTVYKYANDGVIPGIQIGKIWRFDLKTVKKALQQTSVLRPDSRESERLEWIKDEFISMVSHELRTPLTIVKGAISNLKDGIIGSMTDKQNQVIEVASRNIDRLGRLINDIIDLSQLESGRDKIDRKRLDSSALIKEVLEDFQGPAQARQIVLKQELAADLPEIYADANRIVQLFTRLLKNALRHAKSRIIIRMQDVGGVLLSSIIDDGPGISPEDQARLFNKFEQVKRAVGPGYQGTGLGLAICQKIVEHHRGKIWVESQLGKGTTFHVTLPTDEEVSLVCNRKEKY